MKIMQVNVVYKKGSTGKIVHDIHIELLNQGIESIVCYGRGGKLDDQYIYKTSSETLAKYNNLKSRITGLQYNGSWFATNSLINIINREKPDVVHLHCINGYFVNIYKLLKFLKKNKIRTVLTLHAEFMFTGNCGYAFECDKWKTGCGACPQLQYATKSMVFDRTDSAWRMMEEAFRNFENLIIVSVSGWLDKRAKLSPILKEKKFKIIENGIDTKNIFHPALSLDLKQRYGITNEKILIHVTSNFSERTDDIKGGRFIIELGERLINENVKIFVIGGRDMDMKLPKNIINVGLLNNQNELASYYSMADLCVVTSKRETYSMPCAESLACGTPVVGFKAGGPETISLKEYSEFVEYGDMEALELIIRKWWNKKAKLTNELVEVASEYYSKERMCDSYIEIYGQMVNN